MQQAGAHRQVERLWELASDDVEQPLARVALAAQQALDQVRQVRQQHGCGEAALCDLILHQRRHRCDGRGRVGGHHGEHARHDRRGGGRGKAEGLEEARHRVLAVLLLLHFHAHNLHALPP